MKNNNIIKLPSNFWKLWSANVISYFGDILFTTTILTGIYLKTDSVLSVAYGFISKEIGSVLSNLLFGYIATKVNRKYLMIFSDLARFTVLILLALFINAGNFELMIYISLIITSVFDSLYSLSENCVTADILTSEQLIKGESIINISIKSIKIIGILCYGIMHLLLPLKSVLIIDSFSFLFSSILIFTIEYNFYTTQSKKKKFFSDFITIYKEGFKIIWKTPFIKLFSLLLLILNIPSTVIDLFIFTASNSIGYEFGLSYSLIQIVAILGQLLSASLLLSISFFRKHISKSYKIALIGLAISFVGLSGLKCFPLRLPILAIFIFYFSDTFTQPFHGYLMKLIPSPNRPAVLSLLDIFILCLNPIYLYFYSKLIDHDFSLLAVGSIIFIILLCLAFVFKSKTLKSIVIENEEDDIIYES
ncbi:MFS transporter [Spirochaeta cellobiosiphila]|uniref:MFS transporter n=1 Tax=Spirochaeta cellobiosiphila TaxID=504483 RepID=UPI0003F8F90C|nr:MFS transporter [Spirochaeta cellobiosiphila]